MQRFARVSDEKSMRVVLVEDDVALRHTLGAFFRSCGVEVLAQSADGLEALNLLSALQPDLILTDCQMPRMDGITLVRQLRARGDCTPVIMMSGQTDPVIRAMAIEAGVSEYLSKPLSLATLSRLIYQTMHGHAA